MLFRSKMKALGIDEEELWWYIDTRRFGSAVHSGFGLGFERCHELRVNDLQNHKNWRVIYRIDNDAVIILEVFAKTTKKTPNIIIDRCQKRLGLYTPENLISTAWKTGSITEFLRLSPEEIITIEIRLSLNKYLERLKQEHLERNPSSNPRIPKVESVDPSVSIDLLIRSLVEIGATREGIAMAIADR